MKEFDNKYVETTELVASINNSILTLAKLDDEEKINYYPIAFFEVFVNFQNLVYASFENYCIGMKSSYGYCPVRKHIFGDEIELRAFLKTKSEYIDYDLRIVDLSDYIFETNPFSNLKYMKPLQFSILKDVRNYIAHKSSQSLKKLESARIVRDNRSLAMYFAAKYKSNNKPYFDVIITNIYEFANYIIEGE